MNKNRPIVYKYTNQPSGVASPKKVGRSENIFYAGEQKKLQYTYIYTPPPIYQKLFQRICANLRRGLNISGGSGPTHSPRGDATEFTSPHARRRPFFWYFWVIWWVK